MCSGSVRKVEAAAKGVAIDQRQWLQLRLQLQLEHHLLFPFSVHLKPKLWQKRCSDLRPKNWRPGARVSRYSDTDTDGARAAPPPEHRARRTHTQWHGVGEGRMGERRRVGGPGSWGNGGCTGIQPGWFSLLPCSLKTFKV